MNDFGLLIAQYNSSLPTLADGQFNELQVDVNGRLLVQADVTVLIDFLGINGASDNANLLIAGSSDGTTDSSAGRPIRVDNNGRLDIVATDLDIRDLTHVSDSVKVGDGVDLLDIVDEGDSAASGDNGIFVYGRDPSDNAKTLEFNADGELKVAAAFKPEGTESYTVTDALAANADALETITAAATPWVTVASLAVGAGEFARIYGWQWECDQNAQARLITDDTTDIIVYKTQLNSSSMPGRDEHWGNSGRIEITGAANLEIKLQIKKRSQGGGNANGSGSMHIRKL